MSLELSHDQRAEMTRRWFDLIVEAYPAETTQFLRDQSDQFANPVGAGLREELAPILGGILDDRDPAELEDSLDRIIRVRALQDMSPADAVGFVLLLNSVFAEVAVDATPDDRRVLTERVEQLLLTAFNVYSRCREQVYEIRVNEIRNRSLKVMERLNSWREERAGRPSSDA